MFMPGDEVIYVGDNRRDLRNKIGLVLARVKGVDDEFVVDFETGDSHVVMERSIARHVRPVGQEGPQLHSFRKRHKKEDD